jgi:outer membrane protein assembly factor BamB
VRTFILASILVGSTISSAWQTPVRVDDGIKADPADWPWWRGPSRNGVAHPGQDPPTQWSDKENVAWKSPIPGRGHGSPTVVANRIFLATADETKGSQSIICFDRATGEQLWLTEIHATGLMKKNEKSSGASSTVACDGERVFINFVNNGGMSVTALDLSGKQLWQSRVADYKIHQGFGSSPAIYQSLVLVSVDSHAGGALAGLDRNTGKIVWKVDRPKTPNYTSPIILHIGNKDQVVYTGCNVVVSLEPLTGKLLWETKAGTTESVTSTVTDGERVFSTGGYPKNHLAAVFADGSGKIAWETRDRVYVPSLLAVDQYLFGILDAGIAACWKSDTGLERWKKRLRGEFSASPVLVGDRIYATSEAGETFVFRADPEKYEEIAVNKLGDEVMATPTICGGRIYMRLVREDSGSPQDYLYCLAK